MDRVNNYFKLGRDTFLFFDDRSRASAAEAYRQARLVQDFVATPPRLSVFRRTRHGDSYDDVPAVGEYVERLPITTEHPSEPVAE